MLNFVKLKKKSLLNMTWKLNPRFQGHRLNPVGPRGGGGVAQARMTKLTAASQKPLNLLCPNFLGFILKTCSDQILTKLINQGVDASLFSLIHLANFESEKIFLCLKIAETDMGRKFWVKKNDSGHKNSFF